MPVVITPEGEWLQDASIVIQRHDERFPSDPVLPATTRQRIREALDAMPQAAANEARAWVRSIGGQGFLDLKLPRMTSQPPGRPP